MQTFKVYGYARVSSTEQNLARQLEAIKKYAEENNLELSDRDIITDKISGKTFDRPGYQFLAQSLLRRGDYLIIKELDRLGRDYEGIKEEWRRLTSEGICLIIIDSPLLSLGSKSDLERMLISNIVFELLAYTAARERDRIRSRQSDGIRIARAKGVKFGRPTVTPPDDFYQVKGKWEQGQITAKEAMARLGLKRTTFYKLVKDKAS